MRARTFIAVAGTTILVSCFGASAALAKSGSLHPSPVGGSIRWTQRGRPTRPDAADWQKIRAAAHLRDLALEPHRSAHFRAFSAFLGLSELVTIHPLGPGRCATAVIYLYNNLLDLHDATPGENWNPLRRIVAKEPSIRACAPPERRRVGL